MKRTKLICILIYLTILFTIVQSEKIHFDKYRVYSLTLKSPEDIWKIKELEITENGYEIWKLSVADHIIDILVSPHKLSDFEGFLQRNAINSTIKINNLQQLIDQEEPKFLKSIKLGDMDWKFYHTLDEIYAWLDDLLIKYPTILTSETVGISYQGRQIRAVKLSHKSGNKAILLEANIHAREWISSATATWILNELLTSEDPETQFLAENVDWYIIPVANPDGFVYSKTTNRMWRKTRYPHFQLCYGADGNRNFDFQWMSIGASENPCRDTYAGPKPFSEPETIAFADFYLKHKNEISVHLAFHSYGQYILLPYGYTKEPSDNHEKMMEIGKAAANAIRQRYDTEYRVGSISDILYYDSGSSQDWIKGVHNINVSLTFEFRDKGKHGYVLPPEQIIPNSEECLDGLKALVQECKKIGYL